jgi:hypothetical protein
MGEAWLRHYGGDEEKLTKFRQIRDEIEIKVKHWLSLSRSEKRNLTVSKSI